MTQLALVVTCMGRLHHLCRSLPLMIERTPARVVVSDYSCPDHAGDWAEREYGGTGRVAVVRTPGHKWFNKSSALNRGYRLARELWGADQYVGTIDADTLLGPQWWPWVREHLEPGAFLFARWDRHALGLYGMLVAHWTAYERSGGYCEDFAGWGAEDQDQRYAYYYRCRLRPVIIPPLLAEPIEHEDVERTAHYVEQDIQQSNRRNWRLVHRHLEEWTGRPVSSLARRDLAILTGFPDGRPSAVPRRPARRRGRTQDAPGRRG